MKKFKPEPNNLWYRFLIIGSAIVFAGLIMLAWFNVILFILDLVSKVIGKL